MEVDSVKKCCPKGFHFNGNLHCVPIEANEEMLWMIGAGSNVERKLFEDCSIENLLVHHFNSNENNDTDDLFRKDSKLKNH